MAGNQFGFSYNSFDSLRGVYYILVQRLEQYMEEYILKEQEIVYVELSFRRKHKVPIPEFSFGGKNKLPHIDKDTFNKTKKDLNIPFSINEESLGIPLSVEINNGFITNIILKFDNNVINFLSLIKEKSGYIRTNHMDQITSFDSNYKFYLNRDAAKI
jgi:hypothetical protein